jgi:hypothetical protein
LQSTGLGESEGVMKELFVGWEEAGGTGRGFRTRVVDDAFGDESISEFGVFVEIEGGHGWVREGRGR